MSWLTYILSLSATLQGGFSLIKDWKDFKKEKLHLASALTLIIIGLFSIFNIHSENNDKEIATKNIELLKGQVIAARDAQDANTKQFIHSFKDLNTQITQLETEVKTEALQKKLSNVQLELEKTQKALDPPKASLDFTFFPLLNAAFGETAKPNLSVTLPLNPDGSVHVEFTVMNHTNVHAVDITVNLMNCQTCKYKTMSPELMTAQGVRDSDRVLTLRELPALSNFKMLSVDIIPPAGTRVFQIGINWRCRTCSLPLAPAIGTITISNP